MDTKSHLAPTWITINNNIGRPPLEDVDNSLDQEPPPTIDNNSPLADITVLHQVPPSDDVDNVNS